MQWKNKRNPLFYIKKINSAQDLCPVIYWILFIFLNFILGNQSINIWTCELNPVYFNQNIYTIFSNSVKTQWLRKGLTSENTVIDAGSHRDFRDYLSHSHFINEKKSVTLRRYNQLNLVALKVNFLSYVFLLKECLPIMSSMKAKTGSLSYI